MHTNSKRTTVVDLSAIIEGLIKADVKFILVGGLAAVVQGAPVTTMDVDEGKTYEDLFKHTVEIEFRGHTLRVLDIKMLIELKRTSKDSKDKQRLPVLEETLRQLEKELFIDSDVNQNNKTAE